MVAKRTNPTAGSRSLICTPAGTNSRPASPDAGVMRYTGRRPIAHDPRRDHHRMPAKPEKRSQGIEKDPKGDLCVSDPAISSGTDPARHPAGNVPPECQDQEKRRSDRMRLLGTTSGPAPTKPGTTAAGRNAPAAAFSFRLHCGFHLLVFLGQGIIRSDLAAGMKNEQQYL